MDSILDFRISIAQTLSIKVRKAITITQTRKAFIQIAIASSLTLIHMGIAHLSILTTAAKLIATMKM